MNAELNALKAAYEIEEMSIKEISITRGLDITAVKAGLMQCSTKYRKDCRIENKNKDTLNFSKAEQQRIKDALLDLALGADDPHLQFKVLMYCRDDAKGRKDIIKNTQGLGTNIIQINNMLQRGREVASKLLEDVEYECEYE